jgi:apolipoprotein N-acyltransferase
LNWELKINLSQMLRSQNLSLFSKCFLATIFGVGLTISFAPSEAWWFAIGCLSGFFLLLSNLQPWDCFKVGCCFGLGWFGAGFWWMFPGLNNYSSAGVVISFFLSLLLIGYMALYPACVGATIAYLGLNKKNRNQSQWTQWVVIASLWAISEWIRGQLFGGLPWLTTGYSQTNGPFAGFAPLAGVYGLSFLTVLIAFAFGEWLELLISIRSFSFVLIRLPVILIVIATSGHLLQTIEWTEFTGRELNVALLQGNLPQHDKFSRRGLQKSLFTYSDLAIAGSADLIVLPETAFPIVWTALPAIVKQDWRDIALSNNAAIVIGTVMNTLDENSGAKGVSNSVIAILPGDEKESANYRYDKVHLIPFGETIPFKTEWLNRRLNMDFSWFVPGSENQLPLILPKAKIAMGICFESLFDTVFVDKARQSEVLLNVSNFAWFVNTYAPAQHLQVAQLRAIETGRWFLQVANTGITGLIDQHGHIQDALPQNVTGMLQGKVKLYTGNTPFMLMKNAPLLFFCFSAIVCGFYRRFYVRTSCQQ